MCHRFLRTDVLLSRLGFIAWIFWNVGTVHGASIYEDIPLNKGNMYRWEWIAQCCLGAFGMLYNGSSLYLMLSLDDSDCHCHFYTFNIFINISDFIYSTISTVFPILELINNGLYGPPFCNISAAVVLLSIGMSMFGIAAMSFVAKYNLCSDKKLTKVELYRTIAGYIVYLISIAMFVQYLPRPYGGDKIDYSGLYCFIDWSAKVSTPVVYVTVVFLPLGFVCYNVYVTYTTMREAQAILNYHGIHEQAKGYFFKMTIRLIFFVVGTLTCYVTSFILVLYQMSTRQYFPLAGAITAELSASCLQCIVNPTLFYYLNVGLREKFWEKIGIHIVMYFVLPIVSFFKVRTSSSLLDVRSLKKSISKIHPTVIQVNSSGRTRTMTDFTDVEVWIENDSLRKTFEEYCRSEYVIENLLFIMYVRQYIETGKKLQSIRENQSNHPSSVSSHRNEFGLWKDIQDMGEKIFTLFLKSRTAPLEVNISCSVRGRVLEVLTPGFTCKQLSGSDKDRVKVVYPEYSDDLVLDKYLHVFDEALECVLGILKYDVWPRFQKSRVCKIAVLEHSEKTSHA